MVKFQVDDVLSLRELYVSRCHINLVTVLMCKNHCNVFTVQTSLSLCRCSGWRNYYLLMPFTTVGYSILIAEIVSSGGTSNTIAMSKQETPRQQNNPRRPSSRKSVSLSRFKSTTTTSAAPSRICSKALHSKERPEYRSSQAKLARAGVIKSKDKKGLNCGKIEDAPTKYVFHIIKLSSQRDWTKIRSKRSASKRTKSTAQASETTTQRNSSRTRKAPSRVRRGI